MRILLVLNVGKVFFEYKYVFGFKRHRLTANNENHVGKQIRLCRTIIHRAIGNSNIY